MSLIDKIKKAGEEKFHEFEFDGQKFWLSNIASKAFYLEQKKKEFGMMDTDATPEQIAEAGNKFMMWLLIESLRDKDADGNYTKMTEEEFNEAKMHFTSGFLAFITESIGKLSRVTVKNG